MRDRLQTVRRFCPAVSRTFTFRAKKDRGNMEKQFVRGQKIDLTGQRFGRLTVLHEADRTKANKIRWECQCDCGNIVKVQGCHLRSGHTQSCGCRAREIAVEVNTTHGKKKTRLYGIWEGIKKRCYSENSYAYPYYGGRGIVMDSEWKENFQAFYDWAMSNGYKSNLTIERIDVNGNYEPSNCCWITKGEQTNNTRNTHYITVDGKTQNIAQWAKELGITRYRIDAAYQRGVDLEVYVAELIKKKNETGSL